MAIHAKNLEASSRICATCRVQLWLSDSLGVSLAVFSLAQPHRDWRTSSMCAVDGLFVSTGSRKSKTRAVVKLATKEKA